MEISEKLKLLRKERGLTQSEVGMVIGQERSTIACYETGKRNPDVKTLEKLSILFQVSLDYFSEKSEADTLIELLSRSNSFFSAQNVSSESKTKAMNTIMKLYLENTTEENVSKNEREDYTAPTEREAEKNRTIRY